MSVEVQSGVCGVFCSGHSPDSCLLSHADRTKSTAAADLLDEPTIISSDEGRVIISDSDVRKVYPDRRCIQRPSVSDYRD